MSEKQGKMSTPDCPESIPRVLVIFCLPRLKELKLGENGDPSIHSPSFYFLVGPLSGRTFHLCVVSTLHALSIVEEYFEYFPNKNNTFLKRVLS